MGAGGGGRFSDTQLRFLTAVAERLPVEQVREVYLFPPMRQGGTETGIAVLAVRGEVEGVDAPVHDGDGEETVDAVGGMGADLLTEASDGPAASDVVAAADDGVEVVQEEEEGMPSSVDRFTVFTATYRLQLKGPDRGRWEVDVVEEADAPLITVDAVVRGVHRRSGEVEEAERVTGAELADALERQGTGWTTAS